MARRGLAPKALGVAHPRNETPYVAIGFAAVLTFFATSALSLFGVSNFDGQRYFGTLCTFGFLTVYVLISLAAPAYLYRIGELTKSSIVVAVLAAGFMIIPFLGTIGVPGSALLPHSASRSARSSWSSSRQQATYFVAASKMGRKKGLTRRSPSRWGAIRNGGN